MPKENSGNGMLVGTIVGTAVGAVGALPPLQNQVRS